MKDGLSKVKQKKRSKEIKNFINHQNAGNEIDKNVFTVNGKHELRI
jgi:hypothetical protein